MQAVRVVRAETLPCHSMALPLGLVTVAVAVTGPAACQGKQNTQSIQKIYSNSTFSFPPICLFHLSVSLLSQGRGALHAVQMLFINESKREKESVNQLTVILKMIVDTTVPHKLL